MKLPTTFSLAVLAVGLVTADASMSTLTVHPACPSTTPSDVIVTRSAVVVPSCGAGNETTPMIVSMSGDATVTMTAGGGGGAMMTPSMSSSGYPAQYTGGAVRKGGVAGVVMAMGGVVVALVG